MAKTFIYLVQTGQDHGHFKSLESDSSDYLVLFWRNYDPTLRHAVHYPNSTWSQGRNRLLELALQKDRYEYYIFIDDDVRISFDPEFIGQRHGPLPLRMFERPLKTFERYLTEYEPAIGLGGYDWQISDRTKDVQALCMFDACLNAFQHETLSTLLPYYERFDRRSWWWSQEIMCDVAATLYAGHCLQFNAIRVTNLLSRPYPRGAIADLRTPYEFIRSSVIDKSVLESFVPFPGNRDLEFPIRTRRPYHYTAEQLSEVFDVNHDYWKRKAGFWERARR